MSIATAIQNARTKIAAAYTSCDNKGATMPVAANQNLSNLATTIDSIPTATPINQTIQTWVATENEGTTTYSRGQINVGANYTRVGDTEFQYDETLVAVILPETVTSIGKNSFDGCKNLKYINLENVTTLAMWSFSDSGLDGELHMPNLTGIGWGSFNNTKIKKITSLGSITQLRGNTSWDTATFKNCTELREVVLPSTLTDITCAFYGCTNLNTINLENISILGQWAFRGCDNLHLGELYLPNLTYIDSATFGFKERVISCNRITSLGHITELRGGIPASRYGVFSQFKDLIEVNLHEGITKIGATAFFECTSLPEITLPSTVTRIEQWAFGDCPLLKELTCLATTPPDISGGGDAGFSNLTNIYVPSASVSAYQSASVWSSYASKIQAIP